jgi:hypothetical protein
MAEKGIIGNAFDVQGQRTMYANSLWYNELATGVFFGMFS